MGKSRKYLTWLGRRRRWSMEMTALTGSRAELSQQQHRRSTSERVTFNRGDNSDKFQQDSQSEIYDSWFDKSRLPSRTWRTAKIDRWLLHTGQLKMRGYVVWQNKEISTIQVRYPMMSYTLSLAKPAQSVLQLLKRKGYLIEETKNSLFIFRDQYYHNNRVQGLCYRK